MRTAYGIDILPKDDPYIKIAEESLQALSAATNAGAYLVDSIPIRVFSRHIVDVDESLNKRIVRYIPEWFPGARFQRDARLWRPVVHQMLNKPFDHVKSMMVYTNLYLHRS